MKDNPKLNVMPCIFESDENEQMNIELVYDFIQNDINLSLSSHPLEFDKKIIIHIFFYIIIFSAFVFTSVLFFIKTHNNDTNKNYDDIWKEDNFEVELKESSLNNLT